MEQTLSDKPVTACKMIATGIALPPTRVTSAELDARPGKPAGYVEKRCGIAWRYHASLHDSQAELALVQFDRKRRRIICQWSRA